MVFFEAGFPFSYGAIISIGIIGICLITFVGFFSFVVFSALVYIGVIRISPILDAISNMISFFWPDITDKLYYNINKSFLVEYPYGKPEKQAIFLFHPHGSFSMASFFHIGTHMTDWATRRIKATMTNLMLLLPFAKEIIHNHNCVLSDYNSMNESLEKGDSLAVCLGGTREVLYTKSHVLNLNILKKRGVFKMALKNGCGIVPVLTYGENELFQITENVQWINNILIEYGLCMPIPTMESFFRWFNIINRPLDTPLRTVVGKTIDVETIAEPTEEDILNLREKYFKELRELYKSTKPSYYAEEINII